MIHFLPTVCRCILHFSRCQNLNSSLFAQDLNNLRMKVSWIKFMSLIGRRSGSQSKMPQGYIYIYTNIHITFPFNYSMHMFYHWPLSSSCFSLLWMFYYIPVCNHDFLDRHKTFHCDTWTNYLCYVIPWKLYRIAQIFSVFSVLKLFPPKITK